MLIKGQIQYHSSSKFAFEEESVVLGENEKLAKIIFDNAEISADRRQIDLSAVESIAASCVNRPLVGIFNPEKNDFEGHFLNAEMREQGLIKQRYGFIKQIFASGYEENNHSYLVVSVVVWEEYSEIEIDTHPVSIEIEPTTAKTAIIKDENGKLFFQIQYAELDCLCILGKDRSPGFEGCGFIDGDFSISFEKTSPVEPQEKKGGENLMEKELYFSESWSDKEQKVAKAFYEKVSDNAWVIEAAEDRVVVYLYGEHGYFLYKPKTSGDTYEFEKVGKVRSYFVTEEEEAKIDADRLSFEAEKATFEETKTAFEAEKTVFEETKTAFEAEKTSFEETKTAFEQSKTAFEAEKTAFEQLKEQHDKVALEFEEQRRISALKNLKLEFTEEMKVLTFEEFNAFVVSKLAEQSQLNFEKIIPKETPQNIPEFAQRILENRGGK